MNITPEGLVRRVSDVYSLPTVYTELDRKINDPLSSLEDIAEILMGDAGLSARLLRLANSAMYSFPSKIDTITRAITIIGTNQLRDLALATSVITLFKDIDQTKIDMESFWRHSIAVGIASRVIATYQVEPNVERFYLMGLLHDIGRLIMLNQIPDVMSELVDQCQDQQKLLYLQEEEVLGFEHGRVGKLLLQEWKLPVQIVEAVSHHHHPLRSRNYFAEASVIHIADLLGNGIQLGSSSGIPLAPMLDAKAWECLGLSSALVPDILERMEVQYHDVVETFLP
jgi:putative nucleotidyltransferase with HDIG domain